MSEQNYSNTDSSKITSSFYIIKKSALINDVLASFKLNPFEPRTLTLSPNSLFQNTAKYSLNDPKKPSE